MGMAAFRVNEEERQAREASVEETPECPMPDPEPKKTTTVTAKKSTAVSKD